MKSLPEIKLNPNDILIVKTKLAQVNTATNGRVLLKLHSHSICVKRVVFTLVGQLNKIAETETGAGFSTQFTHAVKLLINTGGKKDVLVSLY